MRSWAELGMLRSTSLILVLNELEFPFNVEPYAYLYLHKLLAKDTQTAVGVDMMDMMDIYIQKNCRS